MTRRARLIFFALIGVTAVFVLPANLLRANHDVASPYLETDQVEHLMELTYRTCFGHGADLNGLRAEANARGWKAASDRELKRHESAVAEMIGGWVFTDEFGSFAVMQSKLKEDPSAYICSVTAKLPFDRHDQVKASFERRFAAALAQEADRSGKHIDRFLMTSPHKRPIDASIVYVRSNGGVTINMIQGRDERHAFYADWRGGE